MQDNTNWTPSPDDNNLGLTDKVIINEYEAKGIATAELLVFSLDSDTEISVQLIREIHRTAFSELYEWAGKWRTVSVTVGQLMPPEPTQIIQLMYQFIDNLNFKIGNSKEYNDHIDCLAFSHYEFIRIHPFNNGNGRTGRILMNLVALKFGYKPLELYHREGNNRKIYIDAMKLADKHNFSPLMDLIRKELAPL
ncbi:Fic/DOC family protein [Mucilaginibacter gotjawali]|uniref:Cell filamentation protein n=1 Tax=Mucilaginibacter gotjawali TaxID=1550579 RepID=A0A839S8U9_9SPHI|nr:Fic family protein [Mucilaginibacter gotjawali]MBB3054405.1 cell filamentation protein [Mucilaginibacter gotjawali]